jgi:hypothetical protein
MKTTDNKNQKKGFISKFFGNVAENVIEGATLVGEKVAETSAKAYVASTELVSETSEKIHDFTEKQELHREEKKLNERQQTLKFSFGEVTLAHYLKNDSLHKTFLTTNAVSEIVDEYNSNQKRLKAIDKEIKKIEKH